MFTIEVCIGVDGVYLYYEDSLHGEDVELKISDDAEAVLTSENIQVNLVKTLKDLDERIRKAAEDYLT